MASMSTAQHAAAASGNGCSTSSRTAERHGLYKLTSRIFTTNGPSRPPTGQRDSKRSGSSAATVASTASGRTACSSSGCWGTRQAPSTDHPSARYASGTATAAKATSVHSSAP